MVSFRSTFNIVKNAEPIISMKSWSEIIYEMFGLSKPYSIKQLLKYASMDSDDDGLSDFYEQLLAEKYAPIIYHSSDESNYPTNVNWFLEKTELWFYDDDCTPDLHKLIIKAPKQTELIKYSYTGGCGSKDTVRSNGTRSKNKQRTFYLKDVDEQFRIGSLDTKEWITYFHAYPNDQNGITIQYWRFYSYNDAANNHGGDWEGFHLILDENHEPLRIGLLGHTEIDYLDWKDCYIEGSHVRIFSEGGGHASRSNGNDIYAKGGNGFVDPNIPETFIRQETWKGGKVNWFDGRITKGGDLINLGSKTNPMNNQVFIQYSGIWGSPGYFYYTSGYWGPAFNETSMRDDGFITAWCEGIENSQARINECYPSGKSR